MASTAGAGFASGFASSFGGGLQLGAQVGRQQQERNDRLKAFSTKLNSEKNAETEKVKQSKFNNLLRISNSKNLSTKDGEVILKKLASEVGFQLPDSAVSSPDRLNNFRDGLNFMLTENANLRDKNTGEFILSKTKDEIGRFISSWSSLGLPEEKITKIAEDISSAKIKEAADTAKIKTENLQLDNAKKQLISTTDLKEGDLAGVPLKVLQKLQDRQLRQVIKPEPTIRFGTEAERVSQTLFNKPFNELTQDEAKQIADEINKQAVAKETAKGKGRRLGELASPLSAEKRSNLVNPQTLSPISNDIKTEQDALNAGAVFVPFSTKAKISKLTTTEGIIEVLDTLSKEAFGDQDSVKGFFKGTLLKTASALNINISNAANTYNSLLKAYSKIIVRANFGEVGVMTDADVAQAVSVFPKPTDPDDVRVAKISLMKNLLELQKDAIRSEISNQPVNIEEFKAETHKIVQEMTKIHGNQAVEPTVNTAKLSVNKEQINRALKAGHSLEQISDQTGLSLSELNAISGGK